MSVPSDALPLLRHHTYWLREEELALWFEIAARYDGHVRIPAARERQAWDFGDAPPLENLAIDIKVLERRKVGTRQVPYVGTPRQCWWWVLVDDQGRYLGPPAARLEQDVVIENVPVQQWWRDAEGEENELVIWWLRWEQIVDRQPHYTLEEMPPLAMSD